MHRGFSIQDAIFEPNRLPNVAGIVYIHPQYSRYSSCYTFQASWPLLEPLTEEAQDMLKKMSISSLLLALLLATTVISLQSQTRPRRVTQTSDSTSSLEYPAPRREETTQRRRGRGWLRVLSEISIRAGDSCTPSRERIGRRPRVRM